MIGPAGWVKIVAGGGRGGVVGGGGGAGNEHFNTLIAFNAVSSPLP